jgi:neutral ceramidase
MKTPFLILSAAAVLLQFTSSTAVAAQKVFRAGAAKIDITPNKWPVSLVGSFSDRPATNAFDPLHARALVLDDGANRIAMVVVDNCLIPREVLDDAKRRARQASGVPIDRILISATHTHSAPAAKNSVGIGYRASPEYLNQMKDGIAAAVKLGVERLQPAEIGWGVAQAPKHVFNRRWFVKREAIRENPFGNTNDIVKMNPPRRPDWLIKPAAPTDPAVTFISVRSRTGKPIALFANYSLHYVGGVPRGGVSADYFGRFANLIHERLAGGDEFVAAMSNGTSGDINNINFTNPWPRREPFEQQKIVADYVATAVMGVQKALKFRKWMPIGMVTRELAVKNRRVSPERLRQAHEFLAAPDDRKLPMRAKAYAQWTVELNRRPPAEQIVIQAIRIGELGITTIPCEVFVEIGLGLRKRSPFKTHFTVELANGHYGYLPTPEQHKLGGYETWLGTCRLDENASVSISDELVAMLEQLNDR